MQVECGSFFQLIFTLTSRRNANIYILFENVLSVLVLSFQFSLAMLNNATCGCVSVFVILTWTTLHLNVTSLKFIHFSFTSSLVFSGTWGDLIGYLCVCLLTILFLEHTKNIIPIFLVYFLLVTTHFFLNFC